MENQDPADMGALLRAVTTTICNREGISQAEAARRAGLDPTNLCHSFHNPGATTAVRRMCRTFGYHVQVVPNVK